MSVVPADARHVPDKLELRDVHLSDARIEAAAASRGISKEEAAAEVRRLRRHPPPGRSGPSEENLAYVAWLVLQAQELGEPIYTFVRHGVLGRGWALGRNPVARVKGLISLATKHGYLAPTTGGRVPRTAGEALRPTPVEPELTITADVKTKVIRGGRAS